MSNWELGAFASVDAGYGLQIEILPRLDVSTIHLHAPRKQGRTPELAAELLSALDGMGIRITCLFAGFDGESYADIPTVQRTVGLVPPASREERLADLKQVVDFGTYLKVEPIGLHVGFVPHDRRSTDYIEVVEAVRSVCDYCREHGHTLHLETGQEPADILLGFLQDVERDNLFINFDPANMILYGCGEPLEALRTVGKYVRSVHCKDAIWSDRPGEIWGEEVPVGEGDVDFPRYLAVLKDLGYEGPLTVEREIPQEPDRQVAEIGTATERLRQWMSEADRIGN